MDIDTATKKPRISTQDKEIVPLDDDDEGSISQIKGIRLQRSLLKAKKHRIQLLPLQHIQHLILILRRPFLKWLLLDKVQSLSSMFKSLSLI